MGGNIFKWFLFIWIRCNRLPWMKTRHKGGIMACYNLAIWVMLKRRKKWYFWGGKARCSSLRITKITAKNLQIFQEKLLLKVLWTKKRRNIMEASAHACNIPEALGAAWAADLGSVIWNLSVDTNLLARQAFNPMWSPVFLTYPMDLLSKSQENELIYHLASRKSPAATEKNIDNCLERLWKTWLMTAVALIAVIQSCSGGDLVFRSICV